MYTSNSNKLYIIELQTYYDVHIKYKIIVGTKICFVCVIVKIEIVYF